MSNTFNAKEVEPSLWLRIVLWLDSRRQRNFLYKDFCFSSGINLPCRDIKNIHLPNFYLVKTELIDILREKQNHIIADSLKDYKAAQALLKEELKGIVEEQDNIQLRLKKETQRLVDERRSLSCCKNSVGYIGKQAQIEMLNTKILNFQNDYKRSEMAFATKIIQEKSNTRAFIEQVEMIKKFFSVQVDKYTKSATRKIQNRLNFTSFQTDPLILNEANTEALVVAKNSLKGEKNETKKK